MVSSPIPPPPQQQQQQQQQRRWRHAHERVASFSAPSEVIRVPARARSRRHRDQHHHFSKILVLPGNPGCSAFYAPFAEALSDELGGATEIVALSFHGHETLPKKRGEKKKGRAKSLPLSLDGQVEHAAAFLEKLLSEVEVEEEEEEEERGGKEKGEGGGGRSRGLRSVGVVGHSIGGTVAALAVREVEERRRRTSGRRGGEAAPSSNENRGEALSPPSPPPSSPPSPAAAPPRAERAERAERARVAAVCAMMPYVAFDEGSGQQRALRLLAGTPPARAAASFCARAAGALLPRAALSALVGLATATSSPPLTRQARETVADFARAGGLGHALFLADTEFRALSPAPAPRPSLTPTASSSSAASEGAEKEERKKKSSPPSSEFKFSIASASGIWEPLAWLGGRASVFAVGGGGGEGGGGGGGRPQEGSGGSGTSGGGGGGGSGSAAADGDHWCPPHHLDLLGAQAPLARVLLDPGQGHDFVAREGEGTARAARAVAGLLRETAALAAAAAAAAAEEREEGES